MVSISTLTNGLILAIISARAWVLYLPRSSMKYCWRFKFDGSTVSKSTNFKELTPTLAKAIATLLPRPPSPAIPTLALSRAIFTSGLFLALIISFKHSFGGSSPLFIKTTLSPSLSSKSSLVAKPLYMVITLSSKPSSVRN